MSFTLLAAAATAAATPGPIYTIEADRDRIDVGYVELMEGRPADAIERIRANTLLEAEDPAALINLGTASARLGRKREALGYFQSAIVSRVRYDLELADGTWLDSRRAARVAARLLDRGQTLALR